MTTKFILNVKKLALCRKKIAKANNNYFRLKANQAQIFNVYLYWKLNQDSGIVARSINFLERHKASTFDVHRLTYFVMSVSHSVIISS